MVPALKISNAIAYSTALFVVDSSRAQQQWSVTDLHPASASSSLALAADHDAQVGYCVIGGKEHASLWHRTAESWVDLNPTGASSSIAFGTQGGVTCGWAYIDGARCAGIWNGTAASWRALNTSGLGYSEARAIFGQDVAGFASESGREIAVLWHFSEGSSSWSKLDPPGSLLDYAFGCFGGQQVGRVGIGESAHASVWSGTPQSWVDLNPAGSSGSTAIGAYFGEQVGWASIAGQQHAGRWAGTAESWSDLHPVGATGSIAWQTFAGLQVGRAKIAGVMHAGCWHGSSASWQDLSAVLPAAAWGDSDASGVWRDESVTHVVGNAQNWATSDAEAMLWTSPPVPAPGGFSLVSPIDGDVNVRRPVTLRWNIATGADSYTVIIAWNDSMVPYFQLLNTTTTETNLRVPDNLAGDGSTLYWRVIANNLGQHTLGSPAVSVFHVPPPGPPPPCPYDLTADRVIDTVDLVALVSQFGLRTTPGAGPDFSGNGIIDTPDLTGLLSRYGTSCP